MAPNSKVLDDIRKSFDSLALQDTANKYKYALETCKETVKRKKINSFDQIKLMFKHY